MMIENLDLIALVLAAIGLPLAAAELLWLWRTGRLDRRRWKEIGASASPLLPALATEGVAFGLWLGIYTAVAATVPWSLPVNGFTVIVALVLVDLIFYWEHRIEHGVELLWALQHNVHHSSPNLDQSTVLRISFMDSFTIPVAFLPLVVIGFDPILVLVGIGLGAGYQVWLHTELIRTVPAWFGAIFNTPSHHRVHHGADRMYLGRNLGAILIVWDRLFGTFQTELHRPRYGLVEPIGSANPMNVHLVGLRRLVARLGATPRWIDRWRMVWRHPGWSPS